MTKHFKTSLTQSLCLSLLASLFSTPLLALTKAASTPAVNVAPAAIAASASAPAASSVVATIDPIAIANQALAESEAKTRYSIVLSKGDSDSDFDVLITRNMGIFYSFKYCKSHDKDGRPNQVATLRKLRVTQPNYFNKNFGKDSLIAQYFNGPLCEQLGDSQLYIIQDGGEIDHYEYSKEALLRFNFAYFGASGFLNVAPGRIHLFKILEAKHQYNSLSLGRFLFSKHFSWGSGAIVVGCLGLLTDSIYNIQDELRLADKTDALSTATYWAHNSKYNDGAQFLVDSMDSFKNHFKAGLNLMDNQHIAVRF